MTTATKTITTKSGTTVTIKLTRQVNDKIAYLDGYNLLAGREVFESLEIVATLPNGKTASGSSIHKLDSKFDKAAMAKGAYARFGDAYIGQDAYEAIISVIADLDAENPKTAEQINIETAKAKAIADHDAWYDSPEQVRAREFEREMNNPNSDM